MTKSELRKKYIEKRETLSQDEVLSFSARIFHNFLGKFILFQGQKVHCFLSMRKKNEIDTRFFLDYFFRNKIRVFVPKMVKGKLVSIEITAKTPFIKSSYGILEPESDLDSRENNYDMVVTPLLYCDPRGNRVGYGKGYYDQFFESINSNAAKIGVGFFAPEENVDDFWEKDIPLDYLVTPTEVLSFGVSESKLTK